MSEFEKFLVTLWHFAVAFVFTILFGILCSGQIMASFWAATGFSVLAVISAQTRIKLGVRS